MYINVSRKCAVKELMPFHICMRVAWLILRNKRFFFSSERFSQW